MPPPDSNLFGEAAARSVIDLHVVLQAWFNAEGSDDPAAVLAHFDADFRIISPLGKVTPIAAFAAALPGLRGSRPGLVMRISELELRFGDAAAALVSYRETQTQGTAVTERLSTALLIASDSRPHPVWRHLQETWLG